MTEPAGESAQAALLDGIKVLDLSRVLAGPWATMTLGDLGAEVWKIEHPTSGDDTRHWSPPAVNGISTYYLTANRNKKSIAVDMSSPQGRQIIVDLARRADIVVENFRPASLRKLGLNYEALLQVNPRLIYCSISGYGRSSRLAERPGYDFILQAECGFMSITGEPDGEPMRLGVAFVDLVTGMNAVQAILAALYARERTGKGRAIDLALSDSALHFLANISASYLNTGVRPGRHGNAHPSIVPYQLFACRDEHIVLGVGNDHQFRRLCVDVLDRPELCADERFATNRARTENRKILIEIMNSELSERRANDVIAKMQAAGVPVTRVLTVDQAFAADFATERDVVVSSPHPVLGYVKTVRSPLRFSGETQTTPTAPPLLGQHTRSALSDILGYPSQEIDGLVAAGIVAETSGT